MARDPYDPVPSVSPSGPSGEFLKVDPTPAEFGGLTGAATQKLGQGAQQLGGALAENAIFLQDRQNQIVASDAFNKFQNAALDITGGDPGNPSKKGFLTLQGKDTQTSYPTYVQNLEQARQDIASSLTTDAQKIMFEQASRRLQTNTLDTMRSHFVQQMRVYGVTTNQAAMDTSARAIGADPGSEQTFNDNLAQFRMHAVQMAENSGVENDPVALHDMIVKAEQKAIVARVQGLEASDPINGPQKAWNWLQNGQIPDTPVAGKPQTSTPVIKHLSPELLDELTKHFQTAANMANGAAGVQAVIGGAGSAASATPRGAATNMAWNRALGQEHGEDATGGALVSPKGATGASQMLPSTAQETAQKHGVPYEPTLLQPGANYDSSYSRMLGRLHFGDLVQKYDGNITLASAAYNAGEGRVNEWLNQNGDPRSGKISNAAWAAKIPFDETRNYVMRVAQPGNEAQPSGPSLSPAGYQPAAADGAQPAVMQPGVQVPGAPPATPDAGTPQHSPMPYAREADMIERAWQEGNTRFPGRPDLAKRLVVDPVYEHIQQTNILQQKFEMEQQKAQRDAQNGLMNNVITTLNQDPAKFDPASLDAKDAAGNYVLLPEQRENLMQYSKRRLAETGTEDISSFGSGYTQAYKDIFAAPDDPNKINDLNDILKRGIPGGDLSTAGVDRLSRIFLASRKNLDLNAIHRSASGFLEDAKNYLSFQDDTGFVKTKDPAGEHIFNSQFLPRFERGLEAAIATGDQQKVWDYLSDKNITPMYRALRTQADRDKARLAASGQLAPGDVDKPGAPLPPPPIIPLPSESGHVPQHVQINPSEWYSIVNAPPIAENGTPYTHAAWAEIMKRLVADPERVGPWFDELFGRAGYRADEIVGRLKKPAAEVSNIDIPANAVMSP